jgi:hypothetical protein
MFSLMLPIAARYLFLNASGFLKRSSATLLVALNSRSQRLSVPTGGVFARRPGAAT